MSSAGISFGGLASGLDTKAIISALVSIEQRPIFALEAKKTSYGKQKTLFGDLRSMLDKLSTAAKALKQTTDFLQMKAASDDETVLTASASSTATPGSYRIEVEQLARAQVSYSNGRASGSAAIGTPGAEFEVNVGGVPYPLAVVGATSLDSIAAAINGDSQLTELGVRAEVVNTGATSNPYQLVVRSTETGADNAFSLTYSEGNTDIAALFTEISTNTVAAQNAQLVVNGGITVYRPTNQISDLFGGLTLDLKSAKDNEEITVTVSTDAEATSKKVTEFVDAYNKVVDFFTAQNALDSEGKAQSALFGDPTLRSLRSGLRTIVGASVDGTGNEAFQLLSQLGITADTQGKLTFNSSKFAEVLADDENAVASVFTEGTNGIAGRLIDQIEVYTDSVDGLLKSRTDSFDRLTKDTQNRIDQSERRLTLFRQRLETKYANLESLLSRLQSQGSSINNINNLTFS